MLSILGNRDTISRINGIPNVFPTWASIRGNWLNINACSSSYVADTLADLDPADGSWVEKRTYNSCGSRGAFVEYLIINGGHNVPNTGRCTAPPVVCNALGSINNDIDPSVEIWNFFNSGLVTSLEKEIAKEKELTLYPNPSKELLFMEIENPILSRIQIFNSQGRLLWDKEEVPSSIDVSALPNGAYFLKISNSKGVQSKRFMVVH